jgi:hypothetical protein
MALAGKTAAGGGGADDGGAAEALVDEPVDGGPRMCARPVRLLSAANVNSLLRTTECGAEGCRGAPPSVVLFQATQGVRSGCGNWDRDAGSPTQ